MSEDNTPKKPSFIAYQVNKGQDGKSHFNRVGAAFEHGDGEGHNILLDSIPVDGRLTLRTPQERLDDMRSEGNGDTARRQDTRQRQSSRQRPDAPEYDR